jgi:hypothetical protein
VIDYASGDVAGTNTLLSCTLEAQLVFVQYLLLISISIIVTTAVIIAVATTVASELLERDNIMVGSA